MPTETSEQALERLRADLERARAATTEAEAKLAELRQLLHTMSQHPLSDATRNSAIARLRAAIREVEGHHPDLVAATEAVLEALGKAGV